MTAHFDPQPSTSSPTSKMSLTFIKLVLVGVHQYQDKFWGLVSHLKAKNTLEELDVLRFFEFKVEEFPYKTFFYDYDDLKAINKSGYTEHYLGKCIAKCFFRLSKVFFHQEETVAKNTRYYLI